jgi:glycosyltransferase involved in cell wall biosynthesis
VPPVSVTIITLNEASRLADALDSVAWADERVVVDGGSTDETLAIAKAKADRVEVRAWTGYADQKNYAASLARHEWILSLDADERVSLALADEIRQTLRSEPTTRGFRVPRVTNYLGQWIRCTDWWPDWQLRLYDRRSGQWARLNVHESVRVEGTVGRLHGELLHHPYGSISEHIARIDKYTTLAAADLYAQGRRASWGRLAMHPPFAFFRNYILRFGIRQGIPGLVVSLLNSYYVLLKFAKLWELQRRAEDAAFEGSTTPEERPN